MNQAASSSTHALGAEAVTAMKHVDGERLIAMQRKLASFGLLANGGVAREALTTVELDARRWLCSAFDGPQYRWSIDDAANLFLRRAGTDDDAAPVMTGSHIDTQPVGGWLDGAYGVIAGLEVMRALDDAGIRTRRPLEVAIWTNEEGSRFNPGAMGSSAFATPHRLDTFLNVCDAAGTSFRTARDAARTATPAAQPTHLGRSVHAYIEAHIEQGPVLEDGGQVLGIVTGIQGVRWFEVEVRGCSAHAGTTPLSARKDALMRAAQLVSAIGTLAETQQDPALRLTVGRFDVARGSINTIADQVVFTIDLRHPDDTTLDRLETAIHDLIDANDARCSTEMRSLMRRAPTVFDTRILDVLDAAVVATGEPFGRLGSGAFHDAMFLADICPTAMLFVPSRQGISHHPAEDTAEAELIAGARALAGALTALATR